MATVGFIGLGIMGRPMSANLLRAGYSVIGYSRKQGPSAELVALGGRVSVSIADVARSADVVITMLPDSPDVEEVALGSGGIINSARPGSIYVDMSTIRPETSRRVTEAGQRIGVRVLDAPVSGGEQGAKEGTLSIMVGGQRQDFDDVGPVLEAMGSTVVYVGPAGSGQTVKAANQLIVAGIIELVAEAIVLLEAHGVDMQSALRVLEGGLAGNQILTRKGASMIARQFDPGFRVDLHHKDLGIVIETARQAGVTIPLGAMMAQLMGALRAQGDGSLDHSALLRLVERLSGRTK